VGDVNADRDPPPKCPKYRKYQNSADGHGTEHRRKIGEISWRGQVGEARAKV
jgi:hypothetical protein